jgi:SNF2 family DNA or RNA helicase
MVERTKTGGTGDPEVDQFVREAFRTVRGQHAETASSPLFLPSVGATVCVDDMEAKVMGYVGTWKQRAELFFEDGETREIDMSSTKWTLIESGVFDEKTQTTNKAMEIREKTHTTHRLMKEVLSRTRSFRFFENLVVKKNGQAQHVLAGCGHAGHHDVPRSAAENGVCAVPACECAARLATIVPCLPWVGKPPAVKHGTKIARIVATAQKIPPEEKIIIFVQFADIAAKVEQAMSEAQIQTVRMGGTVHQQTKALERFQSDTEIRALIMLSRAESDH